MIRDITIGQYYQSDSIIHRLDPRVKLIGTMVYIISLFAFKGIAAFTLITFFLVAVTAVSKVPVSFMLKGMKSIVFLIFLTIIFNMLLTPGEVLVTFGTFNITRQGVETAVYMAVRLTYLIIGSSLMTLTTTPNQLTDGLEKLLGPLSVIKVPVHEIAMMMSIALRFIPILMEETDKIMKAQMARGADFETGNIINRAKNMVPLLVPLFISAFKRANDLAMAMEARCYRGGDGRTKMKPLHYVSADYTALVVLAVYMVIVILLRYCV